MFDQHAVLERSGFGLVRIADQVMGSPLLAAHSLPLSSRWKRSSAPPQEPGLLDCADDRISARSACPFERFQSAIADECVEVERVHPTGASQQHEVVIAGLWDRAEGLSGQVRNVFSCDRGDDQFPIDCTQTAPLNGFARVDDQCCGSSFAHTQTG